MGGNGRSIPAWPGRIPLGLPAAPADVHTLGAIRTTSFSATRSALIGRANRDGQTATTSLPADPRAHPHTRIYNHPASQYFGGGCRITRDGEGQGRVDPGAPHLRCRHGLLLRQAQEPPQAHHQARVPQVRPRRQEACAFHRSQDEVVASLWPPLLCRVGGMLYVCGDSSTLFR